MVHFNFGKSFVDQIKNWCLNRSRYLMMDILLVGLEAVLDLEVLLIASLMMHDLFLV
jgi:hypothetical protein